MKTEDTEALGRERELNQARSKPDIVDQPVRTARIIVHHTVHNTVTQRQFYLYSPSSR